MFALRGIAVSLTFFVLLYCLLSTLVAVAWRSLKLLHAPARSLAALLFALRVLPMAAFCCHYVRFCRAVVSVAGTPFDEYR